MNVKVTISWIDDQFDGLQCNKNQHTSCNYKVKW